MISVSCESDVIHVQDYHNDNLYERIGIADLKMDMYLMWE